jgi:hypothetical protein
MVRSNVYAAAILQCKLCTVLVDEQLPGCLYTGQLRSHLPAQPIAASALALQSLCAVLVQNSVLKNKRVR